jgi:hypothetical protein
MSSAEIVLQRILRLAPNIQDVQQELRFIQGLLRRGFTIDEAFQYELCTEEVSPDLDEDTGLARMKAINDAVDLRKVTK